MILFLINIGLCFLIALAGRNRPLGFWGYFFGSLLLTPPIGILLLLAAGHNRARRPDRG